jgi:putative ABC transport system permease protein
MTSGLADVPMTVPWGILLAIGGLCLTLAVGSALAPTAYLLRVVGRDLVVHQGE